MRVAGRILWATAGWIALALALIGIPLPLMPTVPFALLAAFCFARSSERIHAWILRHPVFGPSVRDWQQHGAIHRRAKYYATASFLGSIAIGVFLALPPFALAAQAIILCLCAAFIWSRPDA